MIPLKTLNCGFSMPALGMGTWGMGGYMIREPDNNDAEHISILKAGLDQGLTHIDTAEVYAAGRSEELAGQAIAGRRREGLFITSKVFNNHLSHDGVRIAVEGSLERLGTDYLDLYLIHQVNEEASLEDTIRGLDALQDEGLVRNIGVSNFAVERLKRAQAFSSHKLVANQVHYNLVVREAELELLEYCQTHDVMLIAYRPVMAGGILRGEGELLGRLCGKYRKTPAQLAINWLVSQRNVATVVAMFSRQFVPENIEAASFTMDAADVEELRAEFPGRQFKSDMHQLR